MAWRGGGAYLNGVPISVSESSLLIESLVATGFPYNILENLQKILGQLGSVLPAVRDVRRAGAAALDLAYVACGRLDAFWEMDLKPWDTAAGSLIVEEAGGKVSCFSENVRWSPQEPEIVASNGEIHRDLISRLS
jgi:myo-inositol-1(or 4)-monophosphatase